MEIPMRYIIEIPHRKPANVYKVRDMQDLFDIACGEGFSYQEYPPGVVNVLINENECPSRTKKLFSGGEPVVEIGWCGELRYESLHHCDTIWGLCLEFLGRDLHSIHCLNRERAIDWCKSYRGHQWAKATALLEQELGLGD
jgi:hypothetical protein